MRRQYSASGVEGVLNNEAEFINSLLNTVDGYTNQLDGLEWEVYNDVPYSVFHDQRKGLLETIEAMVSEGVTPIEQMVMGRMSYSTMIQAMGELMNDAAAAAQAISPRLSNMLADGNQGQSFKYYLADARYRDSEWLGWTATGPGTK